MSIEIKLDTRSETKNGYSIFIYINFKGKRKNIATGHYTFLKDWNEDSKEPKKAHPNFKKLANYIFELKYKINQIGNINKFSSIDKIISLLFSENSNDFMVFWNDLNKELEINNQKKLKHYKEVYNVVLNYKSEIPFDELNYSLIVQFRDYKLRNGCTNNGVHSYLRTFRAVYNEAIRREIFTPKSIKSPFLGAMPKLSATKDKFFTIEEMEIIVTNIPEDYNLIIKGFNNTELTKHKKYNYHKYFMLCFLLGGIDFVDLANLRYDLHVKNNRVKFERFKSGTREVVDNLICHRAWEILKSFGEENKPYLINAHKKDYESLRRNYQRRFGKWLKSIGVDSFFGAKTPRYTFINIGKQLMLNRDVIMELTAHSRGDVHSIYEGRFPNHVKDEVQLKIINSVFK